VENERRDEEEEEEQELNTFDDGDEHQQENALNEIDGGSDNDEIDVTSTGMSSNFNQPFMKQYRGLAYQLASNGNANTSLGINPSFSCSDAIFFSK
jgi:hypothetical protein